MRVVIQFDIDNAAFADDPAEIRRVLNLVADRLPYPLRCTTAPLNLYDSNGNHIGAAEIVEGGAA